MVATHPKFSDIAKTYNEFAAPAQIRVKQVSESEDAFKKQLPAEQKPATKTASIPDYRLIYNENPLKQYPSYTYNLSLHMLPPKTYNEIIHGAPYTPQNVLVASGGRTSNRFLRNKYFDTDFYFDDLNVETVLGFNKASGPSNVTTIEFSIIEPYGVTFVDRLVSAASEIVKNGVSHLRMPYLIQVDFMGYDETGNPIEGNGIASNLTKIFPIIISKIDISVNEQGAKYKIQATSFPQQAFSERLGVVKGNLSVDAKTVADFFGPTTSAPSSALIGRMTDRYTQLRGISLGQAKLYKSIRDLQTIKEELSDAEFQDRVRGAREAIESYRKYAVKISNEIEQANNLSEAINSWQVFSIASEGLKTPDYYRFIVDERIAGAKFSQLDKIQINRTPPGKATTDANSDKVVTGPSWGTTRFNVAAGTSIMNVIGLAVRHSDYITKQLDEIEKLKDEDRASVIATGQTGSLKTDLDWYIVVPEIELGEYDETRNDFQKLITYHIKPFKKQTATHIDGTGMRASSDVIYKEYKYIYTGQNDDVLDLQIEFNTAYYVNLYTAKSTASTIAREPSVPPVKDAPAESNDTLTQPINNPSNTVMTQGGQDRKIVLAQEWEDSMIHASGADMVTVTLKIVGDPDFIKQDDRFSNRQPVKDANGKLLIDGLIPTDRGDIFCLLQFRTPADYKDDGLMDFTLTNITTDGNRSFGSVAFSGLYRIVRVQNKFSGGQFEQELELVRASNQRVISVV